jgi:hypothetical protein
MMHEHEKSDPEIVAGKPTNKADAPAAEPVEPRSQAYSPVFDMLSNGLLVSCRLDDGVKKAETT